MATGNDTAGEHRNSIYHVSRSCHASLERCRKIPALMHDGWAENRLLDFNLWASGVGAFAVPPVGLDYRLQDQLDVRAVTFGLLVTMETLVQGCERLDFDAVIDDALSSAEYTHDESLTMHQEEAITDESDPFAPWSDGLIGDSEAATVNVPVTGQSSLLEQSKADVDSILDQVIRLGVLIRSSSSASRLNKADAYFSSTDYANLHTDDGEKPAKLPIEDLRALKTHLLIYLFRKPMSKLFSSFTSYELSLESDLKGLEQSHREAVESLIYANLRRRNRFWYARRHGRKLATAQNVLFRRETGSHSGDTSSDTSNGTADPTDNHKIHAQKTGPQSTISGTAASKDKVSFEQHEGLQDPFHDKHALSRASVSFKKSGWPHPPKLAEDRKTFRCPCCYLTLSSMEVERWHWRKHLSADICPYTCVLPGCPMETPVFVTRDAWKTHLRLDHQAPSYWECMACTNQDYATIFVKSSEFLSHMRTKHPSVSLDEEALLEICKRAEPVVVKSCPLCIWEPQPADQDPEERLNHIADHMHEFALESLPWMDDFDGTRSARMLEDVNAKVAEWFDGVKSSDQPPSDTDPGYPALDAIEKATMTFHMSFARPTTNFLGEAERLDEAGYFEESHGSTSRAQVTDGSTSGRNPARTESARSISAQDLTGRVHDDEDRSETVRKFKARKTVSEESDGLNRVSEAVPSANELEEEGVSKSGRTRSLSGASTEFHDRLQHARALGIPKASTPIQPDTFSSIATRSYSNPVPSYLFQIDEIYEYLGNTPAQYDVHGIWQPTTGPYASHDFTPGVGASGKTWLCDGVQIREVPQLPRNAQRYKTFSVYYDSGAGFWVLEGDARNPPVHDVFHRLQFNYHQHPPESSYLTNAGQYNMLRVQLQNAAADLLLPEIYHTNATASHIQYGGVVGELPIFLALMAFTTSREYLPSVLPHMFTAGRWNPWHGYRFTRIHQRGVVVKVYNCPVDYPPERPRGSTATDLYNYEIGRTVKYFD